MANELDPGDDTCPADTMGGEIFDAWETFIGGLVPAPDISTIAPGIKRFVGSVAIGVVGHIVSAITDGKVLRVLGGKVVGADLAGGVPGAHAASHQSSGTDQINVAGLSGELADPQPPKNHAPQHEKDGGDELKLDFLGSPSDNTNLNATTSAHGLLRKLSGIASDYLSGAGAWSSPVTGADFGVGSGAGANMTLRAGDGGTTGGAGGALLCRAGSAQSGATAGGAAELRGGGSTGSTAGGKVVLRSGDAGGTGDAGTIELTSGTPATGDVGVVRITNTCLEIAESATVPGPTIGFGYGRYSVENTAPSTPRFTDDTNTSYRLTYYFAPSHHRVTGSSSRGAVNTRIYIFDSVAESAGSDISFTSDPDDGSYWTINTTGAYMITASVWSSVNTRQAINVGTLSNSFDEAAHLRNVSRFGTGTTPIPLAWGGPITAGQNVWISTQFEGDPSASIYNICTILRVG